MPAGPVLVASLARLGPALCVCKVFKGRALMRARERAPYSVVVDGEETIGAGVGLSYPAPCRRDRAGEGSIRCASLARA